MSTSRPGPARLSKLGHTRGQTLGESELPREICATRRQPGMGHGIAETVSCAELSGICHLSFASCCHRYLISARDVKTAVCQRCSLPRQSITAIDRLSFPNTVSSRQSSPEASAVRVLFPLQAYMSPLYGFAPASINDPQHAVFAHLMCPGGF